VLFVDVLRRGASTPLFWRGRAQLPELKQLAARFLGAEPAAKLFADYAKRSGLADAGRLVPDAALVHHVETQLAGAIGSASARAVMASVVEEEPLGAEPAAKLFADYAKRSGAADAARLVPDAALVHHVETQLAGAIGSASARAVMASVVEEEPLAADDILRMLDEASQVRALNRQLESLDKLKDDFMSSVTHELRTPLTSIRAFAELMRDDPQIDRKSTRLNSSHRLTSRMPSSA
jgi:signal transduction histidine kinase